MLTTESKELFEQYYQKEYDFNTNSLTEAEIIEIRKLSKEKRVDYNLAPIGVDVFNWILKENKNIRFEKVSFDSEKIDGMLYIPTTGKERAYIILNSNKPLVNQIFTAVHEYYHYVKDYQKFKDIPYICDFSTLKDINEKKACRFAAEFLLPHEALACEVQDFCVAMNIRKDKLEFDHFAMLSIILTVRYQMPLKAAIYRLTEEGYINNVDEYIENYKFIKMVLNEIKSLKKRVDELYSTENNYVFLYRSTYQDMKEAFETGYALKEDIIEDAKYLNLDMNLIMDFLNEDMEAEEIEEDNDDELFSIINVKRGE